MRQTHRSSSGKKLYAVRDSKGRFKDIQTYKRAHQRDMRRRTLISLFKPWIVKRPDGNCQVLFPLTELDGLIKAITRLLAEGKKE